MAYDVVVVGSDITPQSATAGHACSPRLLRRLLALPSDGGLQHPAPELSPQLPPIILSPCCGGPHQLAPNGVMSTWGSGATTPAGSLPRATSFAAVPHPALLDPLLAPALSLPEQARLAHELAMRSRLARHRFLRKVYSLLALQLLAVALLAVQVHRVKPLATLLRSAPWAAALTSILLGLVVIVLACSVSARAAAPANLLHLAVLTAALGLQVAAWSHGQRTKAPVLAVAFSAAALLVLSVQALQVAADVTFAGSSVCTAATLLALATLACQQLGLHAVTCVCAAAGALLLVSAAAYDAHLMAEGAHPHQKHLTHGVFAVLNVYTDPVTLLLCLLQRLQQDASQAPPGRPSVVGARR